MKSGIRFDNIKDHFTKLLSKNTKPNILLQGPLLSAFFIIYLDLNNCFIPTLSMNSAIAGYIF